MNVSQLLTSIKMDLGIYGLRLPFDDPDATLMEVIKLKTIKTFSVYLPQVKLLRIDLKKDLECIKTDYTESIYIIPDLFAGREIMYIRNLMPRNKLITGNGYLSPMFDGSIDTFNSLMMVQANANLASIAAPPITFKFETPNKLYIYNVASSYGIVEIEFAVEHAENLSTIPTTAWESFYELALLDVKRFLYNTLKHYNELQTAYGTINLRIDEWSNAEDNRKDLIERMKDVYHLETEQLFII